MQERQERERTEALTRSAPQVSVPDETPEADISADPESLPETGSVFPISRIELSGDTILSAGERQQLLTPFLGKQLGQRRIDLLLRRLTAAYLDRGYVTTRAYLAPQNLAGGTLVITVLPGKLESIELNGKPLTGAARTALPGNADGLLKLPDIEQAVDQINRLRSSRVEAQVLPGQSPGSSVIGLNNQPDKPWRLSFGVDNFGQPATGQERRRSGAELDNLLGLWDAWSANHVEARDSWANLFSVSVPWGYSTFSYAYANSWSRTPIGSLAVSTTRSRNQTYAWNLVLDRDSHGRTAFDAALSVRDSWRRINDISLTPQDQAAIRLALSRQQRLTVGSVNVEAGYTRGLDQFGFNQDLPNLPAASVHNRFDKYDLNLGAVVVLNPSWAWQGTYSGQWTQVGLPGAEQIFAGGNASVRGFEEGILSGDRGYQIRNELQWTGETSRDLLARGVRVVPFLFADFATTRLLADADNKRLLSAGIGLRAAWKATSLDCAWGKPLEAPHGIPQTDRLHLNLTLQF